MIYRIYNHRIGWLLVVWVILFPFSLCAQTLTSDEEFKKPLEEVILEIQSRYRISFEYDKDLLKDKFVLYADWRFRPKAEETLNNILPLFDIVYSKAPNGNYRLKAYEYHEKKPEEGLEQLKWLSSLYSTRMEWEKRKDSLKDCFLSILKPNKFTKHLFSNPILTPVRTHGDYTIQNFALEPLPGVYICGSIYMPKKIKGKLPVVFNPNGHFENGRYRADCQYRAATLARMGMISVSYDLYGYYGESILQINQSDHYRSYIQPLQVLCAERIFDFILSMKTADTSRVAITGASGGGSQTMLMTAIDDRIKLSVPVVMMSSWFAGGCPCESGMGIHLCAGGTNNVEMAAIAAPRPQLIISDGKDWTRFVPVNDFPYLKRIYAFYNKQDNVENFHLEKEGHDYGPSKRQAMYLFIAKHFNLNIEGMKTSEGYIDESSVTIEPFDDLKAFGPGGVLLPLNALKGWDHIERLVKDYMERN